MAKKKEDTKDYNELMHLYKNTEAVKNSLKRENDLLIDKCVMYEHNVAELKKQIDELKKDKDDLQMQIKRSDTNMADLVYSNLSKAHTIEFLCRERFEQNNDIEFAAIKSYRNGWGFMYLNGEELKPKNKNVTIWANDGESVQVQIENRV